MLTIKDCAIPVLRCQAEADPAMPPAGRSSVRPELSQPTATLVQWEGEQRGDRWEELLRSEARPRPLPVPATA